MFFFFHVCFHSGFLGDMCFIFFGRFLFYDVFCFPRVLIAVANPSLTFFQNGSP